MFRMFERALDLKKRLSIQKHFFLFMSISLLIVMENHKKNKFAKYHTYDIYD